MPGIVFAHDGEAMGHEKLSTITTSTGFTSTFYMRARGGTGQGTIPCKAVLITVETGDIRITMDGTTPVVTGATQAGHLVTTGQNYVIRGWENIRNFRCINAVNANGAVVQCTFFY
jgi:hypothetical protein